VLGADELQRLLDAWPDLGRRGADVLEAERDLVRDLAHHNLVLGILEHRGHRPRELGRPCRPGVDAADDDAPAHRPAVEVRHERRQRA
jgi:hypothetical protein